MRINWNEVRIRAAMFAEEWKDACYEKGDTQTFYNEFFHVFGVKRRSVARYEQHVKKLNDKSGFIDLFWPSVLIVEQKSAGRDLVKAYGQAGEYFDALKESERPRFILVSDFQTFELYDLDDREKHEFTLAELHKNVEKLGFILGVQKRKFRDQDPVNITAAELVGRLHDALEDSGYKGHDLERFLVRLSAGAVGWKGSTAPIGKRRDQLVSAPSPTEPPMSAMTRSAVGDARAFRRPRPIRSAA